MPAESMSSLVKTKHVIDLDAYPFTPAAWRVKRHSKGGLLEWDPDAITLYTSKRQRERKFVTGIQFLAELAEKSIAGRSILNANVLDYLLADPGLIPDGWKYDEQERIRHIFFPGTIYGCPSNETYVRCLAWFSNRWSWSCDMIECDWGIDGCVALLTD